MEVRAIKEETRGRVWSFLLESDFGERYYQEVCAKTFLLERLLQTTQFLLSSGALYSLLAQGMPPIWTKLIALSAALISALLLAQKLSRSSSTAAQLQEGWTDLHRQAENLWSGLTEMKEADVITALEKLCIEEKALNTRATQTFPVTRFNGLKKLRSECWDATLRDRNLSAGT